MKFKKILMYLLFGYLLIFFGCAPSAMSVLANDTSHIIYKNYSCDELDVELATIESKVASLAKTQDKVHKKDKTFVGVGVTLFWPLIFGISSITQSDVEAELADAKGKKDAIIKAISLNCKKN